MQTNCHLLHPINLRALEILYASAPAIAPTAASGIFLIVALSAQYDPAIGKVAPFCIAVAPCQDDTGVAWCHAGSDYR